MTHPTPGSHLTDSIHPPRCSLYSQKRHNPHRNARRGRETRFLNHLRKENFKVKSLSFTKFVLPVDPPTKFLHTSWDEKWTVPMLFQAPCDFQSDRRWSFFVIFDQSATATIYISFLDIDFSSSMHFAFIRKCACGAIIVRNVNGGTKSVLTFVCKKTSTCGSSFHQRFLSG